MNLRAWRTASCLVLAAGVLVACGYTTRRLESFPGARSIAVMPFHSPGFRRDLDLRLTQAIADQIRARTSFALASPDSADLVLTGTMEASEAVVSQLPDRSVALQRLRGTAEVTVRDRRTGRVVRQFSAFAFTDYEPDPAYLAIEGPAYDEWVRRMSIQVVQGLEPGL
ncbi:MAG: LPS assembly lipoprotein LptE [Planctomycetota bacterium]